MKVDKPLIKSLNPSISQNGDNIITGVSKPLTLASYSIKIAASTIDLTVKITYRHGNIESFNLTSNSIINIENLNFKQIEFVDTNSYNILISEHITSFDSVEEYESLKLNFAPKIYFVA
jgi:hypothetical protein